MIQPNQTIGFITGGQLGQMMIQSFLPFRQNEKILILDGNKDFPCAPYANEVFTGSSKDFNSVLEFGKKCDTIILEFEHVNADALQELENLGKKVFCQAKYIKIIQNKGIQKDFYTKNNIPTSKYIKIKNKQEFLELAKNNKIEFPVMQKTFLDGYDGGGVTKINSLADINTKGFDAESIIEECINITREFSLICGRDQHGNEFEYPLIEQFFHEKTNIVDCITSHCEININTQSQVDAIAKKILTSFTGAGLWAVELFLDTSGNVLVNEIAPRVHNSGHQSIEGNYCSQFEQYMRIALGYSIGNTAEIKPSITLNLLGAENHIGAVKYIGIENAMNMKNVAVHLYGKISTKPNRKMGHVTVTRNTLDECWKVIKILKNTIKIISE
ncbi:TPA: ATP-grasp domain-containing protein [Candidatus Gracilibacteria bacterium]|nr:ATP-grasp domain-containing protein [Candidatus Gracilibacteria bacterium]